MADQYAISARLIHPLDQVCGNLVTPNDEPGRLHPAIRADLGYEIECRRGAGFKLDHQNVRKFRFRGVAEDLQSSAGSLNVLNCDNAFCFQEGSNRAVNAGIRSDA